MTTRGAAQRTAQLEQPVNRWFRVYPLDAERVYGTPRAPAAHQSLALGALRTWYEGAHQPAGGLLVFPTGAGKTFTAMRFLTTGPLSDGYKVLWLAHTHHLLEQAAESLGKLDSRDGVRREVGNILEPRAELRARVVSGAAGHSSVADILATDDVIFATLQTAARAWNDERTPIRPFLASSQGRLCVVFDEAHHAPAPSYARFIDELRTKYPQLKLLGLTATPTYSDVRRRGWLGKLFPQGIIASADPRKLTAQGILAKAVYFEQPTQVVPSFDHRAFERWLDSYGDIPEDIIEQLAVNQRRNDLIVDTYVSKRDQWGKTLIFTDRWFQCDYVREKLIERGVRAEVVYSHVAAQADSPEERNRRSRTDNAKAIDDFKIGDLDVLINVRILTEGTDIPDAQTVFITRQTTSRILLTQMVGRALRGEKFGGTSTANIVMFIDDWQEKIAWAEFDDVFSGEADDRVPEFGKRPPLVLISIDLVRRLVRDMESGPSGPMAPFLSYLPVGWYRVEFRAAVINPDGTPSDDSEDRRELVMVYEREQAAFKDYIERIQQEDLEDFEAESTPLDPVRARIERWQALHFDAREHIGSDLVHDLFHIARHVAQSGGDAPPFFPFEERTHHDLGAIAAHFVQEDLGPRAIATSLKAEYERNDRYWTTLMPSFDLFHRQYLLEQQRLVDEQMGYRGSGNTPAVVTPDKLREREPTEGEKNAVVHRDGYRCLCCHETNRRRLQIDHIAPAWVGGSNELRNLQTLCRICNSHKGIQEVNFTLTSAHLASPPEFEPINVPSLEQLTTLDAVERHVRRTLNFFFRAQAVQRIDYRSRGPRFDRWVVTLYPGNEATWIEPYLPRLIEQIQECRRRVGMKAPTTIAVANAE